MKTLLFFNLIMTSFFGLNKDSNDGTSGVIRNKIEFSILDSQGRDLLNPQNADKIDQSEIRIFYQTHGKLKEVYDASKAYPRNFLVYQRETRYRMRVFLNSGENEKIAETYIKWKESDIDTIKAEFKRSPSSLIVQSVWLNGEKVWSEADKKELHITLIK